MSPSELKEFLDFKASFYEQGHFLEEDPIQLPHRFSQKEDIEIVAFLVSMIAWGNRKSIVKSGERIIDIMGNSPYDYIMSYKGAIPTSFVHRTFNNEDLGGFFSCLHRLYQNQGLEAAFSKQQSTDDLKIRIMHFREEFFRVNICPERTNTFPIPLPVPQRNAWSCFSDGWFDQPTKA